jgi:hypothetical protein
MEKKPKPPSKISSYGSIFGGILAVSLIAFVNSSRSNDAQYIIPVLLLFASVAAVIFGYVRQTKANRKSQSRKN